MPVEQCEVLRSFDQETNPTIKILGVHRCPVIDEFVYHINIPQLFDPCGWVSPVIVYVKMLFQTPVGIMIGVGSTRH
ncbi:hypothetical protein PR048_026875 [Dryococelus australis]|uniref:Uncharacterized protein n=1 Tax=Dryococelus australis TaxID=614101 RepID=A0ABQ9GMH1_9NEOP|nr:hypothetical protein PR048_026875 [Dryococelus australis]